MFNITHLIRVIKKKSTFYQKHSTFYQKFTHINLFFLYIESKKHETIYLFFCNSIYSSNIYNCTEQSDSIFKQK